jgi:branched-chain amino acid transport system permease protein
MSLRNYMKESKIGWGSAALLFLPLILLALARNSFQYDTIIAMTMWAAAAAAWNVLGGYAGQVSIGHAAFFGIGAYTSTLLWVRLGVSPWIGALAGGLLAATVGVALGGVCFRLRGPFFSLVTLAFGEVVRIVAIAWRSVTEGAFGVILPHHMGFANMMFRDDRVYGLIIWSVLLLIFLFTAYLNGSRLGYSLATFREDPDVALALGISTKRVRLIAVGASAFLTALIGTFYAQYVQIIDPPSVFTIDYSVQVVLFSVVGGTGTLLGPIFGAFLLVPLDQVLRETLGSSWQGLNLVIYGFGVVAMLFYLPQGLVPTISGWFARRTAVARAAAGGKAG